MSLTKSRKVLMDAWKTESGKKYVNQCGYYGGSCLGDIFLKTALISGSSEQRWVSI